MPKINRKCRCGECKRCELRSLMKATITRNKVAEDTKNRLYNTRSKGSHPIKTKYSVDFDENTQNWCGIADLEGHTKAQIADITKTSKATKVKVEDTKWAEKSIVNRCSCGDPECEAYTIPDSETGDWELVGQRISME